MRTWADDRERLTGHGCGNCTLSWSAFARLVLVWVSLFTVFIAPLLWADVEPNDRVNQATVLEDVFEFEGQLDVSDTDYYRVEFPDDDAEDQMVRDITLEFEAQAHFNVCLFSGENLRLKCHNRNSTGHILENVGYPGPFHLVISTQSRLAAPTGYRVTFSEPRYPAPDEEIEPNDVDAVALAMAPGKKFGTLPVHDKDVYRITIDRTDVWEIEALGDAVHSMTITTAKGNHLATRYPIEGVLRMRHLSLSPGDYMVAIGAARGEVERDYTFRVGPMQPNVARPPGSIETEPNDEIAHATQLTFNEPVVGFLNKGDVDQLRFSVGGQGKVRIRAIPPPGGNMRVTLDGVALPSAREPDTPVEFVGEVLAGDHQLTLRPGSNAMDGFYSISIEQLNPLPEADLAGVEVSLSSRTDTVAAYWPTGQRFSLQANVANKSVEPKTLELISTSSAPGWRLQPPTDRLELGPGESRTLDIGVDVLADSPAGQPVMMSVGVRDAAGAIASDATTSEATCVAPSVGSQQLWPLPDALLGRVNAAYSRYGAKILTELRAIEALTDGVVSPSGTNAIPMGTEIQIELAGNKPLNVIGFILHPFAKKVQDQLKDFEIATSIDGVSYSTVFKGTLTSDAAEQAFVLPSVVNAKFVQITYVSTHGGRYGLLGEFKVIVAESIAEVLGTEQVNIAHTQYGGHDVYADPFTGANCCREAFSTPEDDGQFARSIGREHEWVMGFSHNRAALIDRIHWQDVNRGRARFDKVTLYTSMSSTTGPWEELAEWEVELDANFTMSLDLETPVWARFVKFVTNRVESVVGVPQQISIFEAPSNEAGLSVLGEWGWNSREAIYEHLHPPTIAQVRGASDGGNSQASSKRLTADAVQTGRVLVGEDEDWYVVTLPSGTNQLVLHLEGAETIEYAYEVMNAAGEVLEPRIDDDETPIVLSYLTAPGEHYIRIYEPPRSVIFAWDTSGSVGEYIDVIDQSMRTFALDVTPGREEVNLIPFQDGAVELVLDDWSGNPVAVSAAVVNIKHRRNSSNAETALQLASESLYEREGTRAVLFITDAESDGYKSTAPLWQTLKKSRPRIFAFEISSRGSHTAQHMMESWADVNRGFYEQSRTAGQLQVGLDRAACLLRRPKPYSIAASFEVTEDLPPGQLVVADPELQAQDAVELILDASGSMFKKLDGRFRYEIAKEVLTDLVDRAVPDDMLFALRVFGHREPRVCRTDVEIELGKLDRQAAIAQISAIEPQPFAGTPIAESLRQVPGDLEAATGRKTVVLVTDGEESCDGDVEKAIAELKTGGVNPQINIIGFDFDAEDKEAARAQFRRWAELGEGRYFDARNADELADSIQAAIAGSTEYEVLSNGEVVSTAFTDSTELTLPVGVYEVRAKDESGRKMKVTVKSETLTEAELPAQ